MYEPVEPTETDSTRDVAAEKASGVVQDTKDSTTRVASTAKDETRRVAVEAKQQAQNLFQQVRGQLTEQSTAQQHRAAEGLRTMAEQLDSMARGSEQSGVLKDLTQQAAERAQAAAGWLEAREPGDIIDEVRRYARSKPGVFLAAAGTLGFVGGRLTRGISGDSAGGKSPKQGQMLSTAETTTMTPDPAPWTETAAIEETIVDTGPPVVTTGSGTYTTGSGVGIPQPDYDEPTSSGVGIPPPDYDQPAYEPTRPDRSGGELP
jgi:hypothetical protein